MDVAVRLHWKYFSIHLAIGSKIGYCSYRGLQLVTKQLITIVNMSVANEKCTYH